MSEVLALPTRKDEDFRYSDLAALGTVWPVVREEIVVAAGTSGRLSLVPEGAGTIARHLVIMLGDGATFDLRALNAASLWPDRGGCAAGAGSHVRRSPVGAAPDAGNRHRGDACRAHAVAADDPLGPHATGTYWPRRGGARGEWHRCESPSGRCWTDGHANARPELEIMLTILGRAWLRGGRTDATDCST
jgi:Fe-S cluster assembly protein SufD